MPCPHLIGDMCDLDAKQCHYKHEDDCSCSVYGRIERNKLQAELESEKQKVTRLQKENFELKKRMGLKASFPERESEE